LKLLKVNFLENNFFESCQDQKQKAIDKPSLMGLGTLRRGGGRSKRPVRESDIKKNTGKIRNVHIANSIVPGEKSPNGSGIH
jgi:hypothetical protein